ncbi:hypothetical protein [Spirosoma aerolatum]|uniref:hypothetical protein n=1 Tax=Spirosoma aerolatum TaxID=1211326 RepID=UPI0009ADBC3D|nr:hypothetical protein [Spirosoma aerolatum]
MLFCFLTSLEGWLLGLAILLGIAGMRMWNKIDALKAQAKGDRPMHPQDRYRAKRTRAQPVAATDHRPQPETKPKPDVPNPLDWLYVPNTLETPGAQSAPVFKPELPQQEQPNDTTSGKAVGLIETEKQASGSLLDGLLPHLKPALFALSIVLVWFGFACWYDNLSKYAPEADSVGDFRILYLKKTIGAILPLISAVGASLGLLFMIHPRYYIYLNGWYKTDYDFYNDLRSLDQQPAFRRVLVFGLLFGLLLLVSLYVLLHSSPQELTL